MKHDPSEPTRRTTMGPGVSGSLIDAAEQELGRRLPDPLRDRLKRDNGGAVIVLGAEWYLHPVWDPTDRRRIRKTANHLVDETRAARQWTAFPEGAISVAEDGTGDRLILAAGSDQIEWWDHETGATQVVDVLWDPLKVIPAEDPGGDGTGYEELVLQEADLHRIQHEVEIRHTLSLPNWKRYNYLVNRVAERGAIWGLRDDTGWARSEDRDGCRYMPVWPLPVFARLCALDDWAGSEPKAIDLREWLEEWTERMEREEEGVEVFPTPSVRGVTVGPSWLRRHLLEALAHEG